MTLQQTQKVTPKQEITKESVLRETRERLTRVDRELADGFELIGRYNNTVTIFGSARLGEDSEYYQLARDIGHKLATAGYTVSTGGSGGIMAAGNRGAFEAGGNSLGFNIQLPHEQELNEYITEGMSFKYFFTRKVILAYAAKAYVYLPGGFGTMDELFELITLMQTKKAPKAPLILVGSKFWNGLDTFIKEQMLPLGTISEGDELMYTITDDLEEVLAIVDQESTAVPHSV